MAYADEVLADTPTAYWRLGATATTDSSGAGRTLTAVGTPASVTGLLTGDADTARQISVSDYYEIADNSVFDVIGIRAFSIEAWIRAPASTIVGFLDVVSHYGNSPVDGWGLWAYSGGFGMTRTVDNVDAGPSWTHTVVNSAIYHLVGTYNGTTAIMYVNGVNRNETTVSTSMDANAAVVRVGGDSRWVDDNWTGMLDEVAWYDGITLTSTRVTAHYTAGTTAAATAPTLRTVRSNLRLA